LLSDVVAATAVADRVGVSASAKTAAVDRFGGLEHALEPVGTVAGVRFVNDSKATNIEAARRALESCGHQLVVIMGGRFKGGDLGLLAPLIASRAEAVVALGEARDRILDAYGAVVRVVEVASLEDAVSVAYGLASPGGTVLLAPACASLDMFKDYAERGRLFKQAVGRLQEDARIRVTTS
jgi:UDP-N-acetylmuramoylalanine--D-glutamate ligase